MITFGGILEITKESDEIFIYDFATNTWTMHDNPGVHLDKSSSTFAPKLRDEA
jgi:hypothetical protein